MSDKIQQNKLGLVVGTFLAIVHAVWALAVAGIPNQLQSFLDWIFKLHSIEPILVLTKFDFVNSIMLVIITFIYGYIIGWVFAWVHNLLHKNR